MQENAKKKKNKTKREKKGDNAKKATDCQATATHGIKKYRYTYSYFKNQCLSMAI